MTRQAEIPADQAIPVLWSFRRCPYAMRARLALSVSGTACWLREIVLREKPDDMLAASPKGTVPVLVLEDGTVIDESLEIMDFALSRRDPEGWLAGDGEIVRALISEADGPFKHHLDRYKYPNRYGLENGDAHRAAGHAFLATWDERLADTKFLSGPRFGLADAAIAPFVRQFANTDRTWFDNQPLGRLRTWLDAFLESARFTAIMEKHPRWESGPGTLVFSSWNDHKAGPAAPDTAIGV